MYYKIASTCIITEGKKRASILDTQRALLHLVPMEMVAFMRTLDGKRSGTWKLLFLKRDMEIVQQYLDFLLENELIFQVATRKECSFFPVLNDQWKSPFLLTNAVLELDRPEELPERIAFFEGHYISCMQLILHFPFESLRDFICMMENIEQLQSKTKQVLFLNSSAFTVNDLVLVAQQYPWLEYMVAYDSEKALQMTHGRTKIVFIKDETIGHRNCGIIHKQYFNTTFDHYTESLHHNTCLNRKISIDSEGNIRNCPGMRESFGNIRATSLEEAIGQPGFRKYWNIIKDQIGKCRDCEFRHVCTDCRAFIETPEDVYSAPLKCGYDPYTCQWEDWSKNPVKDRAIAYYGMQAPDNQKRKSVS